MKKMLTGLTLSWLLAAQPGSAFEILGGEGHIALRERVEIVDDDGFEKRAEASTLRLRLNYRTAEWQAWSAFIEADYVGELGWNNFNSGAGTSNPDRDQYPVIADPNGFDLNQAYVQRGFGEAGRFRIGRQRILLDNQRFVGGVGWRQNEQTYDALSVNYPASEAISLHYAYVDGVNRIFGDDVQAGDHDHDSHLAEAQWDLGASELSAYGFFIDDADLAAFSTRTIGLAWTGKASLGDTRLRYRAQFARQDDYGNNPLDYDADYLRLDASLGFDLVTLGAGYELLEGGDTPGAAFVTPLATLHAFNGWADRFLATPDAGLTDAFVDASGRIGWLKWKLVYHDFETDEGGRSLGSEIDGMVAASFGADGRFGVQLKLADFDGEPGSGYEDVTKTWLMLTAAF